MLFAYSDLAGYKKRPALIISNNKLNQTSDRICCLITSNPHKYDLVISKTSFEKGNLPFKSYVKPHRILTIDERIVLKEFCKISKNFYSKILSRINEFLE